MRWVLAAVTLAVVAPSIAGATFIVPVGLSLTLASNEAPSHRACYVWVEDGSTPAQVLDAATGVRCISGWEGAADRVRCIDGLCSARGWSFYVDEAPGPMSPWHTRVRGGAELEYVLADVRAFST